MWYKWDPLMTRSRGWMEDTFPHVCLSLLLFLYSLVSVQPSWTCASASNMLDSLSCRLHTCCCYSCLALPSSPPPTSTMWQTMQRNADPHTFFARVIFCINSKEAFKGDLLCFREIPLTILFQIWHISSALIIPRMYQGLMNIWWMRENWNESMNKIWIHGWIDEQGKDGWAHN